MLPGLGLRPDARLQTKARPKLARGSTGPLEGEAERETRAVPASAHCLSATWSRGALASKCSRSELWPGSPQHRLCSPPGLSTYSMLGPVLEAGRVGHDARGSGVG